MPYSSSPGEKLRCFLSLPSQPTFASLPDNSNPALIPCIPPFCSNPASFGYSEDFHEDGNDQFREITVRVGQQAGVERVPQRNRPRIAVREDDQNPEAAQGFPQRQNVLQILAARRQEDHRRKVVRGPEKAAREVTGFWQRTSRFGGTVASTASPSAFAAAPAPDRYRTTFMNFNPLSLFTVPDVFRQVSSRKSTRCAISGIRLFSHSIQIVMGLSSGKLRR